MRFLHNNTFHSAFCICKPLALYGNFFFSFQNNLCQNECVFFFSFNIPHDDEKKCGHYMALNKWNYHIMAPTLEYNTHPWSWSPCSSAMLLQFLEYRLSIFFSIVIDFFWQILGSSFTTVHDPLYPIQQEVVYISENEFFEKFHPKTQHPTRLSLGICRAPVPGMPGETSIFGQEGKFNPISHHYTPTTFTFGQYAHHVVMVAFLLNVNNLETKIWKSRIPEKVMSKTWWWLLLGFHSLKSSFFQLFAFKKASITTWWAYWSQVKVVGVMEAVILSYHLCNLGDCVFLFSPYYSPVGSSSLSVGGGNGPPWFASTN